jgi:hypothetical protein
MITKQTFAQVAQVLRAVYFKSAVSDDTWLAYFMALADIPDESLIQAVSEHIANEDDFPTIAGLRRLALAGQYPSPGDAWGEVMRQMQAVGRYRTPAFSHALILQAVEHLGGWHALCVSDNLVADRAHFLRLYEELVRRDMARKVSFPTFEKPSPSKSSYPAQIDEVIQALEDQQPTLPGD